jgi:MFS family permease
VRKQLVALGLATLANFSQVGTRVVISPLVPDLLDTFGTTKSAVGLVLTGMWAMFALSHYPSGVLAERYGERRVVLWALAAAVAATLFLALSPTFLVFTVGALLLGSATGLYFVVGTGYVANQFTERTGRMLGIHSAGGAFAGLAVPVVAVLLASLTSWQVAVAGTGAVVLITASLFAVGAPGTTPSQPAAPLLARLSPRVRLAVLREPSILLPLAVTVVAAFVWQAGLSFLPTFLEEYHSLSSRTAAGLYSLTFVVSTLSMPVIGAVADRAGTAWALGASLLASLVGYVVLTAVVWQFAVVVGSVAVGVGMSYGGAVQALFMQRFDDDERIAGFGTVRTVYMLLGSLGSVVTGTLADWYGWAVSFGSVAVLLSVTLVIVLLWATGTVGTASESTLT